MSIFSIKITESKNQALVTIMFGREESLDNIAFAIENRMLSITASNLSKSASGTLAILADFIGFEPGSEEVTLIIHAKDKYHMHISTKGDYVRFTLDEKEIFYWNADEFADTPPEVLGAVCGAFIYGPASQRNPAKTAEAKQVLQLMDSCDDGDNRCVEFIKQVSEKSGKSYEQISKELEPFI